MERDLTGAILDGRYRVIEPVAEGAMGVVYRAERVKLGRIVAIKVLHEVLPNELSGRKRFEIEAMAMAKLEHPHCASVLDVGVHDDRPFVVMEFVSGQNLKEVIATGPQPIPRATEIVRQVLSGLAHAHEHGIIHRDIKPANIVLSHKTGLGDHVKILDFGLARFHDASQNLTTGIVVGTPAYMAPEQIRGHALDGRADLYACGVLLFELLTGRKPFHSENDDPIEVCRMHLTVPVPRLDARLPGVKFGELEAVVAKALAKDSDDRYASAQEFAAALDAAVVRSPRHTPPVPRSGPIQVTSADVMAVADVSYPPSIEVRSTDVLLAISIDERSGVAGGGAPEGAAGGAGAHPRGIDEGSGIAGGGDPESAAGGARVPRGIDEGSGIAGSGDPESAAGGAGVLPRGINASGPHGPPFGAPPAGTGEDTGSGPGRFLGLALTPAPAGRAGSASGRAASAPRRRSRWQWAVVIGVVLVVGGGATWLVARQTSSGRAPAAPDPAGSDDPAREIVARADELTARGDREAALDLLVRSRRQHPDSGVLAYAAGRLYFAKFYWSEGLRSFRDAIRNDPGYRTDPELIKAVLRGFITTPSYNDDLAGFLRHEIGSAAQPFLEETARDHPSPAIRSRAAAELRRYR